MAGHVDAADRRPRFTLWVVLTRPSNAWAWGVDLPPHRRAGFLQTIIREIGRAVDLY